ncbi:MAG TPA: PDZ domain-containing protein [Candidatus Sulfotelmatobacter sp.]|nr:PDZ domain-containing protein [Candidatus Sulfotelmatobacter sp.]
MRKYVLTGIVLVPFLFSFSHAAQSWSVDPPGQPWVFSSEEGGTGAYLGVDINDVSTERLTALKLKEEKGVEITMVDQDAPAGKAGMKEHDVILTMNGTTIESKVQLQRMIHETPPGRVVAFGLSRDGQPLTIKVQLGDKRKEFGKVSPNMKEFHFEMPDVHVMQDFDMPSVNMVVVTQSARSGLMMENITPQLGEFFGVKNGTGVLVRSVDKGSRAEKAGFRAGDVIVKVNDQPVHDTSDFAHAVKSRTGNSVTVGVVRDKKEQNLNLTLPERKESGDLLEEEESLEGPLIDAESYDALTKVRSEIAKLRPQMELAVDDARKSVQDAQKSLCEGQKKFRDEALKTAEKEQRKFRNRQEKLKMQLDRLRQEMSGNWLEI